MEHAEHALPEFYISLDGKRLGLSPNFSTFVRFEKATGKNGLDPVLWLNPSATDMVTFIWAAVGGEKSGLSIDEVADKASPKHLKEVTKLIEAMFSKADLPEAVKNEDAVA